MPHVISCQHCQARFSLSDEWVERYGVGSRWALKCKQCGEQIAVEGAALESLPAAAGELATVGAGEPDTRSRSAVSSLDGEGTAGPAGPRTGSKRPKLPRISARAVAPPPKSTGPRRTPAKPRGRGPAASKSRAATSAGRPKLPSAPPKALLDSASALVAASAQPLPVDEQPEHFEPLTDAVSPGPVQVPLTTTLLKPAPQDGSSGRQATAASSGPDDSPQTPAQSGLARAFPGRQESGAAAGSERAVDAPLGALDVVQRMAQSAIDVTDAPLESVPVPARVTIPEPVVVRSMGGAAGVRQESEEPVPADPSSGTPDHESPASPLPAVVPSALAQRRRPSWRWLGLAALSGLAGAAAIAFLFFEAPRGSSAVPGGEVASATEQPKSRPSAASTERGAGVAPRVDASAGIRTEPAVAPAPQPRRDEPRVERAEASAPATEGALPAAVNEARLRYRVKRVLRRAQKCHQGGRTAGTAQVVFTIAPSGKPSEVHLVGEPLASAPVASCVLAHARSLALPAFEGASFTFSEPITLD